MEEIFQPQLTAINNTYASTSSITAADIEAAMGRVLHRGGPVGLGEKPPQLFRSSNPCSEIIFDGSVTSNRIAKENIVKNTYKRDFDENVWTVEVPGVPKENIEVFTVTNLLYVQIKDKGAPLVQRLEDGETIKSTKLDLGILTIVVDRPDKKQTIKIG